MSADWTAATFRSDLSLEELLGRLKAAVAYTWQLRESVIYGDYILGSGRDGEKVRIFRRADEYALEMETPGEEG